MANSVSPEVGSHLGWHSTVCWPLRGCRGTYTQKNPKKYKGKKNVYHSTVELKHVSQSKDMLLLKGNTYM
jgi:hypothetical protein